MAKMKKYLGILLAILALGAALAFTACGETDETLPGGVKTYVMEAEYTDLDNVGGAGKSDSKSGVNLIYGEGTDAQKANWSSGYYVGFSYTTDFQLTFRFTSDTATTATIVLRLGSELGDLSLGSSQFAVELNGTAITYSNMFVQGSSSMEEMTFYDKTVTTSATLKAGENVLTLSTLPNTYNSGNTGGPMIDCVKVQTSATLSFEEKTDNPGRRGSII